ncbi:MAG: type II secretion system F family protein [Planctomycetota bacterium]
MPEFCYTARCATGEDITGTLNAAGHREALAMLSARGLFPLKVDAAKSGDFLSGWSFKRRVSTEVLSASLSQLGDLLENGVPLLASLKILADEAPNATLKDVLQSVHDQVAEGVGLDDAMARHPNVFSNLTISLVRAGMEGAFLEEALRRVAGFLERQEEMKGRVFGAMIYPVFLCVVGSIVTVMLVLFFVPKFQPLFDQLERTGSGLPMATTALLAISEGLKAYGIMILVGIVGLIVLVNQMLQKESVQRRLDAWKLKLPIAGKILHNAAVSRFCRVLGTLLGNGVPILKSLRISSQSSGNRLLSEAILESADNVSSGESLAGPLAASGLIPKNLMAMISVAEESNSLETVLTNISDRTDKQIERQLNVMIRLIEPIMLVLIGGVVMFILVALLLPVFDASTSVG